MRESTRARVVSVDWPPAGRAEATPATMMPVAIRSDTLERRWAMDMEGSQMNVRNAVTKFATPVLVGLIVALPSARGQGPVTGQISIVERPGEQTEDLVNTVIFLEL